MDSRILAKLALNYINTSVCDICYEDNCGGDFSCTKGKFGEPCECHTEINEARTKLENTIREALENDS